MFQLENLERNKRITLRMCFYYWYSDLGPVWAETRVQSGDWYGSGKNASWASS